MSEKSRIFADLFSEFTINNNNSMKKVLMMAIAVAMSWAQMSQACTNFLVGKNASTDGSTIISYAADSYTLYGFLRYQPAKDHKPGEMRKIYDWDSGKHLMDIPEVAHTYSTIGNSNEYQLTIGETTWGGQSVLYGDKGIDYGSLIYVTLQRCKTAREAILCMAELVEKYGYASEGESFSIGDPNEIWIMDMIGKGKDTLGAVWVATRIPDDCIAAHANQSRITNLPVKGAKTKGYIVTSKDGQWMWHKDVIKLARERGFYTQKGDEAFSFQAAYNPFDFSGLYVCEARVWSFFRHFSKDMDKYFDYASGRTFLDTKGQDAGEPMPLYIRPDHKVSAQAIRECMRDEYQGTPLDITQGTDAGPWNSKLRYGSLGFNIDSVQYWYERPTATQQTGWSFVSQMRGYEGANAGGIFWFGVDDAACNLYVPMYMRINNVPECYRQGNGDLNTYSPTSAFWTFNMVANWAYTKYSRMHPEIQEQQKAWEERFESQISMIDQKVAKMSDAEAVAYLTHYSCDMAEQSTKQWKEFGIYLMVKYMDGQEKKMEDGKFKYTDYGEAEYPNRLACPEKYLRSIAGEIIHE